MEFPTPNPIKISKPKPRVSPLLLEKDWETIEGGEFPQTTQEEIKVNRNCKKETREQIKEIFEKGLNPLRQHITNLARTIRGTDNFWENPKAKQLQDEIFLITQEAIHLPKRAEEVTGPYKENTHDILNHLGRKTLLRKMTPEQGMALAIQAIRKKDPTSFKKIIFNFKTIPTGPYAKTELLNWEMTGGERLGHLAAKKDFQEAIQYIACNHRGFLEAQDHKGNTLVHTASQWGSPNTINYLLSLSKKLFGRQNQEGKTPLDLESGPQICRCIAIYAVEQDLKLAETTLQKALEACKALQELTPQKGAAPQPLFSTTPKVDMETLSIPKGT